MTTHNLPTAIAALAAGALFGCFTGAEGLRCMSDVGCDGLECISGVCGGPLDPAEMKPCADDSPCGSVQCIAGVCRAPMSGERAVRVEVGSGHTCVIMASGELRCSGANRWHQLGADKPEDSSCQPLSVDLGADAEGSTVVSVAMGGDSDEGRSYGYTCAHMSSGKAKCWGVGSYIAADDTTIIGGWLGYGNTDDIDNADATALLPHPPQIKQIAAGYLHTCAIRGDDSLVCWGIEGDGRIGRMNGNIGDQPNELADLTGIVSDVSDVATGPTHGCAIAGESLWCWGENGHGEVGDGEPSPAAAPTNLTALGHFESGSVTAVAAGRKHTCAVVDRAEVSCWGLNDAGQLGASAPVSADEPRPVPTRLPDIKVTEAQQIVQIVAGHAHSCMLIDDASGAARVSCWGDNSERQLGHRTEALFETTPVDIDVGTEANPPVQISAHLGHHTCAVLLGGEVWCWGSNNAHQIGCGSPEPSAKPKPWLGG